MKKILYIILLLAVTSCVAPILSQSPVYQCGEVQEVFNSEGKIKLARVVFTNFNGSTYAMNVPFKSPVIEGDTVCIK